MPTQTPSELARHIGDDAAMAGLRGRALQRGLGVDWSRLSDHEVIDHLQSIFRHAADDRLPTQLAPLGIAVPAAATPPATPSPSPSPSVQAGSAPSPAAPPAPAEGAMDSDIDAAAQAQTLREAANDGVPFCEECARRQAGGA